jgi:3-oxoadipate enol-lactonase
MPHFEVADLRLFAVDEGQGPPLVFLHGFPLDHSMWDAQRREFRTTHRVLIPDQRGFGKTPSGDRPASIEQFADDLLDLLDAAGVTEPAAVCGLSMGGCVAFQFARKFPQRLSRLVICDARAALDTPEVKANRLQVAERVLTEGPRIVAEAMLPRLLAPSTKEHQPAVVDAILNVIMATSSRGIAGGQQALAHRPDATPTLGEIRVPTLLIVGEHDVISPPAEMQGIAAAIPGGRCIVIPRAGHMAPMEQPAAVNAALREFLS